jgi:hypothetical protein
VFVLVDAGIDQDAAGTRLGGVAAVLGELALELGGASCSRSSEASGSA